MKIMEMIEEAKKSGHGLCWFSEKGPISISKEGVMTPAFVNQLPLYQPERLNYKTSSEK